MVGAKFVKPSKQILSEHYAEHFGKPYYPQIEESMTQGPIFVFVLEGKGIVPIIRKMLGKTDPKESDPGTIRGDYCLDKGRNVCHASDSDESAGREIGIWFDSYELIDYSSDIRSLIYRE